MKKSKDEIIGELKASFLSLQQLCSEVDEAVFNTSRDGKWTPGENFQHLITATKITNMAFSLPKFIPTLLYGKPARTSHGYSKIVGNYTNKLNGGASASGVYIPRKNNYDKSVMEGRLQSEGNKLIKSIADKWSDEQLDNYQIAHPIIGLLTHRELAYFTIYHNEHHAAGLRRLYVQ